MYFLNLKLFKFVRLKMRTFELTRLKYFVRDKTHILWVRGVNVYALESLFILVAKMAKRLYFSNNDISCCLTIFSQLFLKYEINLFNYFSCLSNF